MSSKVSPTQKLTEVIEKIDTLRLDTTVSPKAKQTKMKSLTGKILDSIYEGANVDAPVWKKTETVISNPDVLITLLRHGAKNSPTQRGRHTLLMKSMQHSDAVRAILANTRVNLDYQNSDGATALMMAAELGYIDVIPILLRAGADVHKVDRQKNTVMHYAASSHCDNAAEVIALLYRMGISPNVCNAQALTPLMIALRVYVVSGTDSAWNTVKTLAEISDFGIRCGKQKPPRANSRATRRKLNIFQYIDILERSTVSTNIDRKKRIEGLKKKLKEVVQHRMISQLENIDMALQTINESLPVEQQIHIPMDVQLSIAEKGLDPKQASIGSKKIYSIYQKYNRAEKSKV